MRITTSFDYPPIPVRTMDWSAIDAGSYDASYEGEDENGHHWKQGPVGYGPTEQAAIDDLMSQVREDGNGDEA